MYRTLTAKQLLSIRPDGVVLYAGCCQLLRGTGSAMRVLGTHSVSDAVRLEACCRQHGIRVLQAKVGLGMTCVVDKPNEGEAARDAMAEALAKRSEQAGEPVEDRYTDGPQEQDHTWPEDEG
jgi:hypothetical protein